jgi:HEAT repeat protein
MPQCVPPVCAPCEQYDFVRDLRSDSRETVYAAAKALGFLPEEHGESTGELRRVADDHPDALVRLESAAALARLGVPDGWAAIERTLLSALEAPLRMEAVLILGELKTGEALRLLTRIASDASNPSELRAAAAWSMYTASASLAATPLLSLVADNDELVAVHAVVAASRLMDEEGIGLALARLEADERAAAGVVRAILASRHDPLPQIVAALREAPAPRRSWLLYLLAMLGRARCERHLREHAPEILEELEFFWIRHSENWTNRLDVADQIDFQISQFISDDA